MSISGAKLSIVIQGLNILENKRADSRDEEKSRSGREVMRRRKVEKYALFPAGLSTFLRSQ